MSVASDTSHRQFILCPGPFDVLLGKGVQVRENEGNLHIQKIVKMRANEYVGRNKRERELITSQIVETITSLGGRFLRKTAIEDPEGGRRLIVAWEIVATKAAQSKVKLVFRDVIAELRQERKTEVVLHRAPATTQSSVTANEDTLSLLYHRHLLSTDASYREASQLILDQRTDYHLDGSVYEPRPIAEHPFLPGAGLRDAPAASGFHGNTPFNPLGMPYSSNMLPVGGLPGSATYSHEGVSLSGYNNCMLASVYQQQQQQQQQQFLPHQPIQHQFALVPPPRMLLGDPYNTNPAGLHNPASLHNPAVGGLGSQTINSSNVPQLQQPHGAQVPWQEQANPLPHVGTAAFAPNVAVPSAYIQERIESVPLAQTISSADASLSRPESALGEGVCASWTLSDLRSRQSPALQNTEGDRTSSPSPIDEVDDDSSRPQKRLRRGTTP